MVMLEPAVWIGLTPVVLVLLSRSPKNRGVVEFGARAGGGRGEGMRWVCPHSRHFFPSVCRELKVDYTDVPHAHTPVAAVGC